MTSTSINTRKKTARIVQGPGVSVDPPDGQGKVQIGASGDNYALTRHLLTNRYHIGSVIAPNTTLALTANRLYAVPFFTPVARTITKMAIHVTTLGTGAVTRLGICQDNGSIYPGALVVDAGTVDCSTTGFKSISGLSVPWSPNTLYWALLVASVAFTLSAVTAGYGWQLLGYTTSLNVVGYGYYYVSYTYASLPDPFPDSATLANAATPKIAVYF